MTDPIADMLTRLRNALAVSKAEVVLPYSRMKLGILEILKDCGYIAEYEVIKRGKDANFDQLKVILKYKKPNVPAMMHLKMVSTPGRRVYININKIPVVLNNLGIAIISTSQGLMTNKDARKRKLGGEFICEIY